ncbi:hypothetical protein LF41_21 [Lysobacter dokdonensis DS-58]|uniref:Uncharacterized protein n=1 Tax=Lysobacter dokdonensis DS-58 TaxID=1300345 RepID=A0A0A2X6F0_9GAMM|nr:FG-GAP-like repeat-containing protein [Lysobacter dokdonensis]KGQ20814.1 hypothetical protein LF41_21 [Lysobacter dokdonensis DS-58]
MRLPLLLASAIALAACTAHDNASDANGKAAGVDATAAATSTATHAPSPLRDHRARAIAALPDRGQLLAYTSTSAVSKSAYTWHPIALSEAHALNAIASGTLDVPAPDGSTIHLKYDRAVDHGDGNWTWIGRPAGAMPGTEAIITFGPKAVFGSVPYGRKPALRITSTQEGLFLMETDPTRMALAKRPTGRDAIPVPPSLAAAREKVLQRAAAQPRPQSLVTGNAVPQANTVDVVVGYTTGFASRLGGQSQAVTRLNNLFVTANQAFVNSQINGALRMVGTVQVNYPDNTDNEATLYELSGVTCTENPNGSLSCSNAPIPAALQPLVNARETLHADLMSIVRNFNDPENNSCGIAWLNGGGQEPIDPTRDVASAISVVSDSNGDGPGSFPSNGYVCREETFVHELGHNMGSQHDATTAAGVDGTLDDGEYGLYPYSFGYRTGSFFTIMAYREDPIQIGYRVFSNPRIAYCGSACGTANADNAQSLNNTIPVIASFYTSLVSAQTRGDHNGDGHADILWRNSTTGENQIWRSGDSATKQAIAPVNSTAWTIVGTGDYNGDGVADVVWRNTASGQNTIWLSGNNATQQAMPVVPDQNWRVAGSGDFDGDGKDDLLWRNNTSGGNQVWRSGNSTTQLAVAPVYNLDWRIVGVGDFDGDGRDDVLWRNSNTGQNQAWRSANNTTQIAMPVVGTTWNIAGVGDFNNDGNDDILWRNSVNGVNTIWRSANSATQTAVATVGNPSWTVANVVDFDGDGFADILWRNTNGQNQYWRAANSANAVTVSTTAAAWQVAR